MFSHGAHSPAKTIKPARTRQHDGNGVWESWRREHCWLAGLLKRWKSGGCEISAVQLPGFSGATSKRTRQAEPRATASQSNSTLSQLEYLIQALSQKKYWILVFLCYLMLVEFESHFIQPQGKYGSAGYTTQYWRRVFLYTVSWGYCVVVRLYCQCLEADCFPNL